MILNVGKNYLRGYSAMHSKKKNTILRRKKWLLILNILDKSNYVTEFLCSFVNSEIIKDFKRVSFVGAKGMDSKLE